MKIIYFTDTHWRNEEPFYIAAWKMADNLLDLIEEENSEPFIVVHGGDVFQRSKETGKVNGLVVRFFSRLVSIKNCIGVYIIQGNHDVKKETGSALDCLYGILPVQIISTPTLVPLWNNKYMYLLPHMIPYSFNDYKTIATYGEPEFHVPFIGDKADDIAVTFAHIGDETSGDFFSQADLSFLPGIKCHGHVHKRVSEHYPGSVMITRRDEIDQVGYLRVFDHDLKVVNDVPIEAPFNYLKVDFNEDLLEAFNNMKVKPYGSVVVDVKGHDNEEAANRWFEEQKKKLPIPAFLGSVYPDEKVSDGEYQIGGSEEKQEMNIHEIFNEFCKEKNIADSIKTRIEAML